MTAQPYCVELGYHPWQVIPTEYEPQTSVWDYVNTVNERCPHCGKVKARLYDNNHDWITRYKSGTGIKYEPGEVRPTRADRHAMLMARVRDVEERNARRAAKPKRSTSTGTRKRDNNKVLTAVA